MKRPYGISSLSVSEPFIEDCACPDGVSECCGMCPGCDCRARSFEEEVDLLNLSVRTGEPLRMICMTCEPEAVGGNLSHGWCRRHGLQALVQFDLATRAERVELFLREYWPYILTIGGGLAYIACHLIAWAGRGFLVVSA